jgi:hypothetical protein
MKITKRMGVLIVVAAIAFAGATVAAEELQPVGAAELFIGQPMPPLPSANSGFSDKFVQYASYG